MRKKIAFVSLTFSALLFIIMGVIDITIKNPPANYFEFMGIEPSDMDSKISEVIYGMRSKIGIFAFSVGAVILILMKSAVQFGHNPSRWCIGIVGIMISIGIPAMTYQFGTGPNLIIPPIIGALIALGLVLTREGKEKLHTSPAQK